MLAEDGHFLCIAGPPLNCGPAIVPVPEHRESAAVGVNTYISDLPYCLHSTLFSHFRATDGLLASLAEDLFLQLGLTQRNCGDWSWAGSGQEQNLAVTGCLSAEGAAMGTYFCILRQ